jgi:hypothetical protein
MLEKYAHSRFDEIFQFARAHKPRRADHEDQRSIRGCLIVDESQTSAAIRELRWHMYRSPSPFEMVMTLLASRAAIGNGCRNNMKGKVLGVVSQHMQRRNCGFQDLRERSESV